MEKIRLGISLYPEQESREDIEGYLKTASEHGFTKVFTSLFSVEGTKEELVHYFRELTDLAHKYGMVVSGDCNGELFRRLGAKADDLSVFQDMGLDILRMDDEADLDAAQNGKIAVMFTVAYLYEHREEADHHAMDLTLRALLFGSRKEGF